MGLGWACKASRSQLSCIELCKMLLGLPVTSTVLHWVLQGAPGLRELGIQLYMLWTVIVFDSGLHRENIDKLHAKHRETGWQVCTALGNHNFLSRSICCCKSYNNWTGLGTKHKMTSHMVCMSCKKWYKNSLLIDIRGNGFTCMDLRSSPPNQFIWCIQISTMRQSQCKPHVHHAAVSRRLYIRNNWGFQWVENLPFMLSLLRWT